jgi:competence protein ComEC
VKTVLARATPHLFAGAVCLGLAAANLVRAPWLVAASAAAALTVGAVVLSSAWRTAALLAGLLVLGLAWGSVRLEALDRSVLVHHAGRTEPAQLIVTAPARRGTFSLRVAAKVKRFGSVVLDEPVLLQLPLGRAPPQGARVQLIGTVALPRPPSGGFDERGWLRHQGAHVVLNGRHWLVVGHRDGIAGFGDALHARLVRTIAPGLGGERRAVLAGIVLGEDEGLSEGLRQSFRAAGLYHLLAVSGQNVALLAGGVLLLAWLLGVPRWPAHVAVLAVIGAYVLVVGWQPSVVRAGVAGGLTSLAWLAARQRDRWYFLLLGAIVLLAWNPYALLEPGFQLSFTAVAAIFVAVPRLEVMLRGYPVPRPLAVVLAVSLACGLATAPILWLHFGAVPLFSALSNALAAPVVAPLLGLGLVAALVEPVLPSAAWAIAWGNGWLAAYLAACARVVGGLPHAELSSRMGAVAAVLSLALVACLRLLPRWRRRQALILAAVVLVGMGGWRLWPESVPPPPQGLRVTFLDVGQGDAVLLQVPQGAVLVDQGPPEADVAAQLRRLGVRHLSLLVLTHPQRDHVGGAAEVIERLSCRLILDPRLESPSDDERRALAAARRRGVPIAVARAGRAYRLGRLRLRILWPPDAGAPGENPNLNATVLLASYGETDALLTADAESEVTLPLRPPPVEILKVAHHGSADAGLPRLLALVRPRVAVISVGRDNDYGHPTPSTLGTLERAPALAVYRTDRDGRITIDSDGERIEVQEER